jgi:hypothetical protein
MTRTRPVLVRTDGPPVLAFRVIRMSRLVTIRPESTAS